MAGEHIDEVLDESDIVYNLGYDNGYRHAKADGFVPSLIVAIVCAMIGFAAGAWM